MDAYTAANLIELNQQFYQTFALQFSQTRRRLQPGVRRIMQGLPPTANILDLGCGNGELAHQLARAGYQGTYVGLDFSASLLMEARKSLPAGLHGVFLQVDLADPNWVKAVPHAAYDYVLAFAVLHHLPGRELRLQVLSNARSFLSHQGYLIHSEWQFLNSPRLQGRIQPWKSVGLDSAQVDPDDYLLDWRQGGAGLRYVHHFNLEELIDLATSSGFRVLETFFSDGEGSKLSLYQTWQLREINSDLKTYTSTERLKYT